ncbi:MAG: hypothetical protein ACRC9K_02955, partial [Afipia sp.]
YDRRMRGASANAIWQSCAGMFIEPIDRAWKIAQDAVPLPCLLRCEPVKLCAIAGFGLSSAHADK